LETAGQFRAQEAQTGRTAEKETRFIPARATDNSFNNAEYKKVLENLRGWQKRAWCDGDWDIAAGQYFTNFRRDVHVYSYIDESLASEWAMALDYGFTHYTVVHLGFQDGDGNFCVVDEHAERQWLPERHAAAIHKMLTKHGLGLHNLKRFVAGADVFSKQSDGTTIAQQYQRFGIRLMPANTDRVNGWAEILRRFGEPSVGIKPSLFVHSRCGRLIDTLPNLQHDPHRPEDVLKTDADEDGIGGDDAADCFRYLVHSRGRRVAVKKLRGW
jgi:phage terminase large subunit